MLTLRPGLRWIGFAVKRRPDTAPSSSGIDGTCGVAAKTEVRRASVNASSGDGGLLQIGIHVEILIIN